MNDRFNISIPKIKKNIISYKKKTLLELLGENSIHLYAPCGGTGTCGKCKVKIIGSIHPPTAEDKQHLTMTEIQSGIRLSCKTQVYQDLEIDLNDESLSELTKGHIYYKSNYNLDPLIVQKTIEINDSKYMSLLGTIKRDLGKVNINVKIMREFAHLINSHNVLNYVLFDNDLIDVQVKSNNEKIYGVAIDIGTTTLACYLVDLSHGIEVGVRYIKNPQTIFGADVVSRIKYASENNEGLKTLNEKIIHEIDLLIIDLCNDKSIDPKQIFQSVVVGNTVMMHLFWGLNCKSLSRIPFCSVTDEQIIEDASTAGFKSINPKGKVVSLPGIASFVGADTVSALIAAEMMEAKNNQLLIDLGTNGEIVLASKGYYYTCSTAAGPAFEGAKIKFGMQAFKGAMDSFEVNDDLSFTTIGNEKARGICGSGLVSLVSKLLDTGLIEESGKIAKRECVRNSKLTARIKEEGRVRSIIVAYPTETENSEEILLTQQDIRELQLAKGAIRAGVEILMKIAEIKASDIECIILTGAFGNFIDKACARRIGLFPSFELEKIKVLKNGAGEGAKRALCDKKVLLDHASYYSKVVQHIEISDRPDFQDEFVNGMIFK